MTAIDWETELDEILDGIDKDEVESANGWWETQKGAEFGARKKAEIKEFIKKRLDNTSNDGSLKNN